MSRKIIVASDAANKAKQITDFTGTTWGQLKQHAVLQELYVGNVEAILSPGSTTLNRDEALLPSGDFKVFLVPTKNKAGLTEAEARSVGRDISDAIVKAASMVSSSEVNDLRDQLIATVEDFFNVDLTEEECPGCSEALAEAKKFR